MTPHSALSPQVAAAMQLTTWEMEWRREFASRLLGLSGVNIMPELDALLHKLYRVCFIDAKTFYVDPTTLRVWAPRPTDPAAADPPVGNSIKIVYYAVVNPIIGPVYFEYVTGTSEHHEDPYYQQYLVRYAALTCT